MFALWAHCFDGLCKHGLASVQCKLFYATIFNNNTSICYISNIYRNYIGIDIVEDEIYWVTVESFCLLIKLGIEN